MTNGNMNFRAWIYGMVRAVIAASAHAVVSGVGANWIAPGQFNLSTTAGMWNEFKLMFVQAGVGGGLAFWNYLSTTPLPDWSGQERRTAAPAPTVVNAPAAETVVVENPKTGP